MFRIEGDDKRVIQGIVGARMVLEVQFSETSPQVEGVTISAIEVRVNRNEEGELYVANTISLEE
jgi:hypothetical protein